MFLGLLLALQPAPMPGPGSVDPSPPPLTASGDRLTAALLLTTPPGTPESLPPASVWPALRDAIHEVAVSWEILDPRECRYVLTRPEDLNPDLNMLRRRYVELADAPRVADSERFPPREQINEMVRFNRAFRKKLEERGQLELDRAPVFEAVIRETDGLYKALDAARDGACPFYYVSVRRQSLKKLRDLIGADDYRDAALPPAVPAWRFNELR